ncbi:hypothetical protein OAN307_c35460 [Octadecabacter antarcticus 307]|uniref:Uncharacterized protein n=1 Tax=Octadecabacter antarcticus 307 TaxID=391626 RepID=M9RB94_9RHOB|nr:hypothetical protein OAN307_c35460 [Octadecabacter antarcticus 307]
MVALGPTCALARVSYMTSTPTKAPHKHHPKWPLLTPRQRSHFTLRLTLYDHVRNCHEVSCLKITQTNQNQFYSEFEIKVFGLLDIGQSAEGNYALDYFIDLDEPIVLHYRPEETNNQKRHRSANKR